MADFSLEISLWKQEKTHLIGVDEVGRGAFAGPVVAGAALVKEEHRKNQRTIQEMLALGINDSKKLSAKKRELLSKKIPSYFHIGIGEASVDEINTLGIVPATEEAMRRAIRKVLQSVDKTIAHLLIDAFYLPNFPEIPVTRQQAIIGGDSSSISIAAASIIAKVYRDALLTTLAKAYPQYAWEKNKGYGTQLHRDMIRTAGPCDAHRTAFIRNCLGG